MMLKKIIIIIIISFQVTICLKAQEYRLFKSLSGLWSFSVGDDFNWRLPDQNYSGWDKIYVGISWENQGYQGYNGYAWYKKSVVFSDLTHKSNLILKIGAIDDADEVYFNGTLIGKSGAFPPNVETAYNSIREYLIPTNLIYTNEPNVIAIRVYDVYNDGGITGSVELLNNVAESYLLKDLSGKWKFNPGNNDNWVRTDYDDSNWNTIQVPQKWDTQGYAYLDGLAWYRKTFIWDKNVSSDKLVMVLGKIDDEDEVYLNGNFIGSVSTMKKDGDYIASKNDYQILRAYVINKDMLRHGENILVVRVIDNQYDGGIYEGPVGIMTLQAFENYFSKYVKYRSLFDYIMESIFD